MHEDQPELDWTRLTGEARAHALHAKAKNTHLAYRSDWAHFQAWCRAHSVPSQPAEPRTVALYLTDLAHFRKVSTLGRRLVAISQYHLKAGHASPASTSEVRNVMTGIRRSKGRAPIRKRPLLAADLTRAVQTMPATLLGLRNRALLLIGFAGALRRSELVALRWEQVERVGWRNVEEITAQPSGGLKLEITRSKTDQQGEGRLVGVPFGGKAETCPVRALEAWREVSGLSNGPIFRVVGRAGKVMDEPLSDKAVARIVKQAAKAAGLDPREFSGHSLRSGLATSAAAAGASERAIMEQTGHRDLKTARSYIRVGSLFLDNAAAKVKL